MLLSKYIYRGPNSGVSLTIPPAKEGDEPGVFEVILWNNKEVELPPDNDHIKTLIFNGYLTPVSVESSESKAKKATSTKEQE